MSHVSPVEPFLWYIYCVFSARKAAAVCHVSGSSQRGRCRRGRSEIPHFSSKLQLFAPCSRIKRKKAKKRAKKGDSRQKKGDSRKSEEKGEIPSSPIYTNPLKNLPNVADLQGCPLPGIKYALSLYPFPFLEGCFKDRWVFLPPKLGDCKWHERAHHQGPLNGGGFKRGGGFPIWTRPSFFVLFFPFLSFPDFSGFSRFVRGVSGDFPDLSFSSFAAY